MGDVEETIKLRKNLEGDEHRSSKINTAPSASNKCGGNRKTFNNMATTYSPHDQLSPLPKGGELSLCVRCVITEVCSGIQGTPLTCTTSERCETIPGL
ncbi:unnamed protein product [Microthlaspi erraticum]|uniref:Uncharacterized protein n=1 Tax=Microthlaspi erraticum TaxID=1685480 RepID=A0A6D2J5A0_9BRAS|nr:unnamed protein product [Microthlaspi erraticum]